MRPFDFLRLRRWRRSALHTEIAPDEILVDSQNLPAFDRDQFEGRIERALSRRSLMVAGSVVALATLVLLLRTGNLQLVEGRAYAKQAQENQLAEQVLFADRGIIRDRNGTELAWNVRNSAVAASSTKVLQSDYSARVYAPLRGLAHVVGYAKAPAKDSSGFYYRDAYVGVDGAELVFDQTLSGQNGLRLTETDARGNIVSESTVRPPAPGAELTLSLDAAVTEGLYSALAGRAAAARAQGAAGLVMDVATGELIVMTSYPEYDQEALAQGVSEKVASYNADRRLPFLNRATDGLYAPGSIVKPLVAAAAITEGVIDEYKQILSTGSISVPNPYDPEHPSIFKDWRVNGWTDARRAIAVSSDIYFYEVGGGFQGQKGLGIDNIDKYFRVFGFGSDAGLVGFSEKLGTIPTPLWKASVFPSDPTWRVGDTYHTAIGQYGVQITPLQAARMTAAIANGGVLLTPTLLASSTLLRQKVPIDAHALQVAREGMRMGVTDGIAAAINFSFVHPAAKTGTAQVGVRNEYQNAWMIGFWPYEHPRYAFAVVLERMPAGTMIGGSAVMSDFFTWLREHAPGYLE